MPGMEIITVILGLVLAGALGAGVVLALARRRGRGPAAPVDPNALVEQVVRVTGQAFQTHLQTGRAEIRAGHAELSRERDVFDTKWEPLVARVNEELSGIRGLVAELQKDRAAQHEGLTESLRNAADQQNRLLASTQRLNDILGNPQARGQWGERMADDILRSAGLIEGVNYRKQLTTSAGTRPDFSFDLPDGRLLHMDVKFPLEAYVRYLEAGTPDEETAAVKDFGRAVWHHIRETSRRDAYRESISTVGFVLMFVPNERVYAFIHEHHAQLLDQALSVRVVVCSPFTLFGMVSLVRQAMDTIALERSSQEILDHLAVFTEEWGRYLSQVEKAELHLSNLNSAFGTLRTTRQRKLERSLERIEDLKTRTPKPALAGAADSDGLAPAAPEELAGSG
ncbi:MAG: DNA recombination protein RmuC [Acidimicrobiia bacterium]|nr:DNA recombination protein RmuC [Acidimicrobiia bacterium]